MFALLLSSHIMQLDLLLDIA